MVTGTLSWSQTRKNLLSHSICPMQNFGHNKDICRGSDFYFLSPTPATRRTTPLNDLPVCSERIRNATVPHQTTFPSPTHFSVPSASSLFCSQHTPKRSRCQEMIKYRAEINQVETKELYKESIKPGAGSLRKQQNR